MFLKKKHILIWLLIIFVTIAIQGFIDIGNTMCGPFSIAYASEQLEDAADLPTGTEQIVFVELGSVNCIPCKQMKPVMEAIKKEYAGKVKVVFHDVWTSEGKKYAKKYDIRLIPTQVFLDQEGNEIARHEGFFPQEKIESLLAGQGVIK